MIADPEWLDVGGRALRVVRLAAGADCAAVAASLAAADLPIEVPVVVLVGGAGGLAPDDADACLHAFELALVPVVEAVGAVLVDGGTNSGIMALVGFARRRVGGCRPYVGVAAEGTVRWPGVGGTRPDAADLEPHHTHIIRVPGDQWGDETPWLSRVASALAGSTPSVTVLANGGEVAYDDVGQSLAADRQVLVLSGTGRTAQQLVAAREGREADSRALALSASPLLNVVTADPAEVREALTAALSK